MSCLLNFKLQVPKHYLFFSQVIFKGFVLYLSMVLWFISFQSSSSKGCSCWFSLCLGCVLLLLFFIVSVVLYSCHYFLWPWSHSFAIAFHVLLLLLFTTLVVLNGLSKGVCDQGNGFCKGNNVPNGSSIGNGLLCFCFWVWNPYNINITSKNLCNHKLSKVMGFVGKKPRFLKT